MVVTLNTALVSKTSFMGNSKSKQAKSAPIHINYGVHDVKPAAKNPMSKGLLHKLGRFIAGTAFAGAALTSCQPGYDLDLDDAMIKTPVNPKDTTEVVDTIKSAQPEYTIGQVYDNELDSLKIRDAAHKGQDISKMASYHDMTATLIERTKDYAKSNNDSLVFNDVESIPGMPEKYNGYTVSVLKKVSNNSYDEYVYSADESFNIDKDMPAGIRRHELKSAKEGRLDYIGKTLNTRVYNVAKDSLVEESAFSQVKKGVKILNKEYAVSTGIQTVHMDASAAKNAAKTVVKTALKNVR